MTTLKSSFAFWAKGHSVTFSHSRVEYSKDSSWVFKRSSCMRAASSSLYSSGIAAASGATGAGAPIACACVEPAFLTVLFLGVGAEAISSTSHTNILTSVYLTLVYSSCRATTP